MGDKDDMTAPAGGSGPRAGSGLTGGRPEDVARLAAMAERVAAQVASLSRPLEKDVEPAHVFRVVEARAELGLPGSDTAEPGAPR